MNETLYNARGLDETRVRRAFSWVITFRDFPAGSYQTVDGDSMMKDALTLFTKGRAEFYLDGDRRKDRVPGILSSEHDVVGQGGTFKIVYVEPTTRVCIPRLINRDKLPNITKIHLQAGEYHPAPIGFKALVCLGSVTAAQKTFAAETTFMVSSEDLQILAQEETILLDFTNA